MRKTKYTQMAEYLRSEKRKPTSSDKSSILEGHRMAFAILLKRTTQLFSDMAYQSHTLSSTKLKTNDKRERKKRKPFPISFFLLDRFKMQ